MSDANIVSIVTVPIRPLRMIVIVNYSEHTGSFNIGDDASLAASVAVSGASPCYQCLDLVVVCDAVHVVVH